VYELRFFFHGGLRIYYSICDGEIVLLFVVATKVARKKILKELNNFWRIGDKYEHKSF